MFQATIDVQIEHRSGPWIEDEAHVIRWLTDLTSMEPTLGGFTFEVCTGHDDPEECPEDCGCNFAQYAAIIFAADLVS